MRSVRTFILLLIVAALIAAAMFPLTTNGNGNVNVTGEITGEGTSADPFLIHDATELSMVGKGSGTGTGYDLWTLDAYYELANNIVFDSDNNTNGGVALQLSISYAQGTKKPALNVKVTSQEITSLYMWFAGMQFNSNVLNEINTPIPSEVGTYTMIIGGTHNGDGGTFVYTLEIDTTNIGDGWTTGAIDFDSNGNFDPIGHDPSNAFTGTFDGAGYEISGMNVAVFSSSTSFAGVFGYVKNATIKNLGTEGTCLSASLSNGFAGGITGYTSATAITNCYNKGDVTAVSLLNVYAGGISGSVKTTITDCYNTGNVTASAGSLAYAGGIIGNNYGDIRNCHNTGDVTATSSTSNAFAGGIAGEISSSPIANCYNTGNVTVTSSTSNASAGGIAGEISSSSIANCYNTGNVTASAILSAYAGGTVSKASSTPSGESSIEKCYNNGHVDAASFNGVAYAGGIAGTTDPSIISSYFLDSSVDRLVGDTEYKHDPDDPSGARSSDEMKNKNTYENWDFIDTWSIISDINDGYPILRSITVTVIFDGNGGTPDRTSDSGHWGTTIQLPDAARPGYTFQGWNEPSSGTAQLLAAGSDYTLPQNGTTLYAVWTADVASVTFDGNGAEGSTGTVTGVTGETIKLPKNGFIKDGYVFTEWNTSPDGSGYGYKEGDELPLPPGTTTLYAVWEISARHTVTVKPPENGKVECPDGPFADGTNVEITVSPADGYRIGHVTDNGTDVSDKVDTNGIYLISAIDCDHEIVVTFESISSDQTDPAGDRERLPDMNVILIVIAILVLVMILMMAYIILRR